ncbi:MAG: type II toxin-antitoxin system HicB family antitoxin [Lachnospiraceae bacterium]|nr:type II toxin-antitoxin system HicB family antitoxin [Lachnospiraceae bacterium]
MENNILEYMGYLTKIEYSVDDKVLYGKIEGINDLVTFESDSVNEIEKEFHSAVDDYLAYCKELGQDPDKTYSGTFNVRIDSDLHKKIALYAYKNNISLNKSVELAIEEFTEDTTKNKLDVLWKDYNCKNIVAKFGLATALNDYYSQYGRGEVMANA